MLTGPSIAGLLMTGLVHGRPGFSLLWKRLFKWRVSLKWYALALLATPVLGVVILLLLSLSSPDFELGFLHAGEKAGMILSGIMIGMMVGLFEEIGWSGFAVPNMRLRYGMIATGTIVGLVWGAWHFILFWEGDTFAKALPFLILLGRLFTWRPPFRILMVWMLEWTQSLLLVILTHASLVFTTTVIVPMTLTGMNLLIWLLLWGAALWVLALVISRSGSRKD